MVRTLSTMLELGTVAPEFCLPDAAGNLHRLSDFAGASAYLIVFMCNHCPYVKHIRAELAELGRYCADNKVAMIGINANDYVKYPDDSPEKMIEEAAEAGYGFPYLIDDDQSVAHAYQAACTPDFFLFDRERRLTYRGQLDDSRPSNGLPVTGRDLRAAIGMTLSGQKISEPQRPSMGCNIKWKPGNEPAWFG